MFYYFTWNKKYPWLLTTKNSEKEQLDIHWVVSKIHQSHGIHSHPENTNRNIEETRIGNLIQTTRPVLVLCRFTLKGIGHGISGKSIYFRLLRAIIFKLAGQKSFIGKTTAT